MVTHDKIEQLGFKRVSYMSNGGSAGYMKVIDGNVYLLDYHGDNGIYKRDGNSKLKQIDISCIPAGQKERKEVSTFIAISFSQLKKKLNELKLL